MANDAATATREQTARTNAIAICRQEFTETQIQGCKNYATTAVNQWKKAQIVASGCKLSGPRWHSNWDAHFGWCIGNFRGYEGTHRGAVLMTSENAARNAEMKGCVGHAINRDQRFPTKPSSQGKTLSS